jgi:hypothetical protein
MCNKHNWSYISIKMNKVGSFHSACIRMNTHYTLRLLDCITTKNYSISIAIKGNLLYLNEISW